MKGAVVTLVIAISSPAVAGHRRCREMSTVVGYQQCTRFGASTRSATLAWELVLTTQRLRFDPINTDVSVTRDGQTSLFHVTARSQAGAATSVTLRSVYNLTQHFHVATALTFGELANGPQIQITPVRLMATAASRPMVADSGTTGVLAGGMMMAGVHGSAAGITFGAELGFGPRLIVFDSAQLPGALFGDGGPVLEARAYATLWISPHWSIGAHVASGIIDRDEPSVGFSLGLHAFPYDGGR